MKKFYTTKKVIMLLIMAMTATSGLQAQTMKVKKIVSEAKEEKKEVYEDVNLQRDRNPVTDLELERKENNSVLLTWNYPEGFIPKERATLSWSGPMGDAYAILQSKGDIAHRYEVSDLQDYIGWKVKYIGIVPISDGHYHSVRIWEGPEGDSLEQVADNLTLIYEKLAENLSYNVRNYITIDSEITIEKGKEFWFGVYTNPIYTTYQFTWAADKGPAVPKKGDLYRLDDGVSGWNSLSDYLFGNNFCIEVILENPDGKMVRMGYGNGDDETEELEGYEIYADEEQIAVITYTTGNAEAVCGSIEILTTEEGGMTETSISKVYPNPGENILNIRTSFPEGRIEIYDILGKMIYKQYITEEVTKISTEGWAKGMYLWKVFSEGKETESGKWIKQ